MIMNDYLKKYEVNETKQSKQTKLKKNYKKDLFTSFTMFKLLMYLCDFIYHFVGYIK